MSDQLHASVSELEEQVESAYVPLTEAQLNTKLAELAVPSCLLATTHAKNLGEYINFTRQGEVITSILLNAMPAVSTVELTPSVYLRRMHTVYACLKAFIGEVPVITKTEVMTSFDPGLPYAEKVQYKHINGLWTEFNWINGKLEGSGRRQYPAEAGPRTHGVRIPISVIAELDAYRALLISGHPVRVGLDAQEPFANWVFGLVTEGKTLKEYMLERVDRFKAKAMNRAEYQEAKKYGGAATINVNQAKVDGKLVPIELVPDGKYAQYDEDGKFLSNIALDKGKSLVYNVFKSAARRGVEFRSL